MIPSLTDTDTQINYLTAKVAIYSPRNHLTNY